MRLINQFMKIIASFFTKASGFFITFHAYPNNVTQGFNSILSDVSRVGIIVQGPFDSSHDFTIDTLRSYRKAYPNAKIVFSSWLGLDSSIVEKIKKMGIHVILSKKTAKSINNINLQIKSTSVAIEYLKPFCDYILKTRSDQRCSTSVDFISGFMNLLTLYPSESSELDSRLIFSSLRTFRNRLYGVPDFLMFGKTADMELYWCIPFDTKTMEDVKREPDSDFFIREEVSEGFLVHNFFKNVNYSPTWNQEDSDEFLAKYFCVINSTEIGHFWHKYNWFLGNIYFDGNRYHIYKEITFMYWLEKYLNLSMNKIR